jgi:DNA-directed RNA polymerase subunit K/omega
MEQLRDDSRIIHPEVQSVSRSNVNESLKNPKLTLPYYTKYEYVTLVGTRAQQLAEGARPLVSLDGLITSDPTFVWKVAEKEVAEKRLPFIIHRRIPNGIDEYWNASELSIMW